MDVVPVSDIKVKLEFSNPKRFSYFLGPDAKIHTPTENLIKKGKIQSEEDLKERFSLEVVTKEFYTELQNWYFWAMDKVKFPENPEIKDNPKNATNLIRLITRLMFVWFLKEKKLVPDILFNEEELVKIIKNFNKNKESNYYYNAILQNLFFATLNRPIEQRAFAKDEGFIKNRSNYGIKNLYRYENMFLISEKKVLELFNSIPFVNGGLFDCLDDDSENGNLIDGFTRRKKGGEDLRAKIPDYLFFQKEEIEVDLSKYLEKAKKSKVRGLINILKTYHFTVDENSSIDQEISLDPEMLGMVFENLLASYNPETSQTARKSTGSYYTPREIVDYMVEESVFNYLKSKLPEISEEKLKSLFLYFNDEDIKFSEEEKNKIIKAIDECKVLDPAVGSGAFPMGLLHKLVMILEKIDSDNRLWQQIQYRKILEEYKMLENDKEKDEKIKELNEIFDETINNPNYSRKLYIIENSIYGVDIQPIAVQIAKLRFFISLLIEQKTNTDKTKNYGITPLPNLETKFVCANTLISLEKPNNLFYTPKLQNLEEDLKGLRHRYFRVKTRTEKKKIQEKDKKIREEILNELRLLNFPQESAEKIASFDIFNQNVSNSWFDPEWMFGVKDGFDIVIGNPPYIQLQKAADKKNKYADFYKNQNYQTFERTGDIYCLFYEKGINLLKQNGFLCYITSNKWMRAGYGEKLRDYFAKYNPLTLIDLGPGVFENATVDTNILLIQKTETQNKFLKALTLQKQNGTIDIKKQLKEHSVIIEKLTQDAWFIGSNAEQALKEKIERIGKPLKDWDVNIYRGVLTGLNEAFIITTEKRNEILANCKDKAERKRTEAIIKPILRGRDIKRYYYEWAGLWVIVIPAGWTNENREKDKAEKFIEKTFPSLMTHLKPFEVEAKKRDDQGDYWWELRACAYYSEFEKEKVVWNRITKEVIYSFVDRGFFVLDSTFFIVGKNLKYIIALLNSQTCFILDENQFMQHLEKVCMGQIIYVENLPLPPSHLNNQHIVSQIEKLVDKILAAKKQNPQADTSKLEKQIDQLVYKLYDLTEEEIKIIKES